LWRQLGRQSRDLGRVALDLGQISHRVSILPRPFRLIRDHSPRGGTQMKYLLLIHQGDTPTPRDPEAWGKLSEDEQNAAYAAYGEINNNPNITPRAGMAHTATA